MSNKRALKKFVENYKEVFGVELTEAEAEKMASRLIQLFRAVYGDPLHDTNRDNHHGNKEAE